MKIQKVLVLVAAGSSLLACSCTLLQPTVAVAPVGPGPGSLIASGSTGYLKVYTHVEGYPYEADYYYFGHSDYNVYDHTGRRVRSVQNADLYHSLTPRQVALPPGHYEVIGWGDIKQLVKVPVVIKEGCLTTVNLEKDGRQIFKSAKQDDLVHTPDGGIIVGWAANVPVR